MKRNVLRYIIFLATISVAGILLLQFLFLKNSIKQTEKTFHENTTFALEEVTYQLLEYNKKAYGQSAEFNTFSLVDRVSNEYYIVNVNDRIDYEILKFHLIQEFKRYGINTDFEFAVYDCDSDKMVYGAYICAGSDSCGHEKIFNFEKSDKYTYYFGVNFPDRSPFFNLKLKAWYFSTMLLLLIIFFFGYTLFVIIRQRQLSDIQKNFINNLTHELKTPISAIGLSARVLNNKDILNSPNRLFEYAGIIEKQNSKLSKSVEKVLNLASLEKNNIQLNLESVFLDEIIEASVTQFNHSDPGKDAEINIQNNLQGVKLIADKFHFSNILINILENAAKYSATKPVITIQASQGKKHLFVSIIDNGIGIPKELRHKIFNKFYRIPTGNVHNVKGFGLGLDYVKKIIKAHGWKIRVEDNPSGGTVFKIIIPSKSYGK